VSYKPGTVGGGPLAGLTLDYGGSQNISTLNTQTTTLGQSTGIGINKPGTFPNPDQYQYPILPFIFGTNPPTGSVQDIELGVQVPTTGILEPPSPRIRRTSPSAPAPGGKATRTRDPISR
jgi:hypothetical protein